MLGRRLRVLVVDDSPVVRRVLSHAIDQDPRVQQVATAPSGQLALRKIAKFDPHVVTMDVEMPGMDGIATLKKIMEETPRPVVMVSAVTQTGATKTMQALEGGAVDFIAKPITGLSRDIIAVCAELIEKIVAVAPLGMQWHKDQTAFRQKSVLTKVLPADNMGPHRHIVAIGASTGGTEAIRAVLAELPADFPTGIVIVQHMPQDFTKSFARRLNELCAIEVKEAEHKDMIHPGRALLAPGHSHMQVHHTTLGAYVELSKGPKVTGHRPSVDVLFHSVAQMYAERSVAVLLTGMGQDGAQGMLGVHDKGGLTLAQNAESCVVFGMPKAAIAMGAVHRSGSLGEIARILCASVGMDEKSGAYLDAKCRI